MWREKSDPRRDQMPGLKRAIIGIDGVWYMRKHVIMIGILFSAVPREHGYNKIHSAKK